MRTTILPVILNENDKLGSLTISNGNLTVQSKGLNWIRATHGRSSGKWYWEVKLDIGYNGFIIGVANKSYTTHTYTGNNFVGFYGYDGYKYPEATSYSSVVSVGDIIGVALDLDNGTLEFYINGVSQGKSHTNLKNMGEVYPIFIDGSSIYSKTATFNFGAAPFASPVPDGFLAYNIEIIPPKNKVLFQSKNGEIVSFYSRPTDQSAIPKMTSNTTPSGIASSSSVYTGGYSAYLAFDKSSDSNSGWISSNNTYPQWLSYEFPEPVCINKYSMLAREATVTAMPKEWSFEGWDGDKWVILDKRLETGWQKDYYMEFTFQNFKKFKAYRIYIINNNGYANYVAIGEMQMFYSDISILSLPEINIDLFDTKGVDEEKLIDIDFKTDFNVKTFLANSFSPLEGGKVFSTSIDTLNMPIKKIEIQKTYI
ncbi:hypothetical protein EDM57_21120 [Brevibacillus gelatini]|uniref:B30.2/SPRY domain-containing protein n=1 Tax=Brevibacillus gelatini TaxID=1655277 RepID=A0A3M8ANC1_9BACL|nr:SPRY domain-containing protein [Brevibacillus gelatini]RNB52691.1 hypothetical protein EDM57_21120 [Brevibacillus gelatini]